MMNGLLNGSQTHRIKNKFSIKDFFNKCDQIRSHLLKKSLMKNFIFVKWQNYDKTYF